MSKRKRGRPRFDIEATQRFADTFRSLLKDRNLTQVEVANKLDTHYRTVNQWAQGISMPTGDNLAKLAGMLGVAVGYLKGETMVMFEDDINAQNEIDEALIVKIADTFTEEETSMTVDALNGVRRGEGLSPVSHLVANVGWCINNEGIAAKWDVEDPQGYIDKLNLLTEPEAEAFIALVIRFWNAPNYRIESVPARLREVGLVRE